MNHYEVLGVSRDATADQIKQAYRRLALKHHPDRNQGDPTADSKFKSINEAYAVLNDTAKRVLYDRNGMPRQRSSPSRPQQSRGPARRPHFKNDEEKWAWIAAHDPNMGHVYEAPPPMTDVWGNPLKTEQTPPPKARATARPKPAPRPRVDIWGDPIKPESNWRDAFHYVQDDIPNIRGR